MKKLILFSLIFLILICGVLAIKPSQTFTGLEGLELRSPQAEFIKQNENVKLNMHVFNLSNGLPVVNTSASCHLHLYNSSGNHIFDDDIPFGDVDYDFTAEIPASNFSEVGFYSFIAQCNTSRFGGFTSGSIIVTPNGEETPDSTQPFIIVLILIAGLFLYWSFKLDDDHFLLKLLFMFITFYALILVPAVFINGWDATKLSLLRLITWSFRFFVTYLCGYIFYHWVKKSKTWAMWTGKRGKND